MSKSYKPYQPEQDLLLPPSLKDWLPEKHLTYFVSEVVDELDLSGIYAVYEKDERGQPPYDPRMMTKVLVYGYCVGVYSARKIQQRLIEDVAFRVLAAGNAPDFRTIADFRKQHLEVVKGLFEQVLKMALELGAMKLGRVALDGSKVKANASKHKAMSYARMIEAEDELAAEISNWLERAAEADTAEDVEHGEQRGDEVPDWLRDKQRRLERIRAAKAELEAEAKAAAEAKSAIPQRYRGGRKPKHPPGTVQPETQRNFTDPDSRIMIGRDGFIQAYNAQAAVDRRRQIILAHRLSNNPDDHAALVPLVDAARANTGRKPLEISGDAGFCSEANLAELHQRNIRAYLAVGRAAHPAGRGAKPKGGPLVQAMRGKLRRAGHHSRYRLRKQIVEPVFGQIKQARGFRQFLLRGISKVTDEWALICTAHNLSKLITR
jgi:transposase